MAMNETGLGGVGVDIVTVALTLAGWAVASLVTIYGINYTDRKRRRNEHLRELKEKVVHPIRERLEKARRELPYSGDFELRKALTDWREGYLAWNTTFTEFRRAEDRLLLPDLGNHYAETAKALRDLEGEAGKELAEIRMKELQLLELPQDFVHEEMGWENSRLEEAVYQVFLYRAVGLEDEIPVHHRMAVEENETASRRIPQLLANQPMVGDLSDGILDTYRAIKERLQEVEVKLSAILASKKALSGSCKYLD